jgi:hypothetical protein
MKWRGQEIPKKLTQKELLMEFINQELCAALQQLVDVMQGEHTLTVANVAQSSVSASHVTEERRGRGSFSTASKASVAVDPRTRNAHYLRTLGHDNALRQFVIVWIAAVLMSARVDFPMGSIADAIHCSKNNRVCRVGWAAEGACIALVTALKAAERVSFVSDDRRESITEAFGCFIAHYSFSKSFDLKSLPISIEHCLTSLMKKLFATKKTRKKLGIDISDFFHWRESLDLFDARTFFTPSWCEVEFQSNIEDRISRTLWQLALHSLNTDHLRVFSRNLVTSFKFAATDFAKSVLSQVIHGHQKVTRQFKQRTDRHPRYGWHESSGAVKEWKTSKLYRSAFHMKFSAALVAEGAFLALLQALDSAETNETRASIALAMAFLASSAEICQETDSGVASAAAKARDLLRKHLNKIHINYVLKHVRWNIHALGCSDFLSQQNRHSDDDVVYGRNYHRLDLDFDFSSSLKMSRDREIMADALEALCENGPSSTVPLQGVEVTVKRTSAQLFSDFAYHGNHVLSDTLSHYEGQWSGSEGAHLPDPREHDYTLSFFTIQGRMHGKGVLVYGSGDSYAGEWIQGRKSGNGVYKWRQGGFFAGEWFEGKPAVPLTKSHLKKVRYLQHANAFLALGGRDAPQQPLSCAFRPEPFYSLNLERALSARSYFSCLFAGSQSELCRTRCKEVIFIAERLTSRSTFSTNEHFLRMSCTFIVQRVFCGHQKRLLSHAGFRSFLMCLETTK